jgi:hypothetical protein
MIVVEKYEDEDKLLFYKESNLEVMTEQNEAHFMTTIKISPIKK